MISEKCHFSFAKKNCLSTVLKDSNYKCVLYFKLGASVKYTVNFFYLIDLYVFLQGYVDDVLRFVTFYMMFAVILAQLVIASFVDKQPVGALPLEDEVK